MIPNELVSIGVRRIQSWKFKLHCEERHFIYIVIKVSRPTCSYALVIRNIVSYFLCRTALPMHEMNLVNRTIDCVHHRSETP